MRVRFPPSAPILKVNMKYSESVVRKAVETVLPYSPQWPTSINLPTLLDMAAIEIFLYEDEYTGGTTVLAQAKKIIQIAMKELKEIGWMTFGLEDDFWT